jgi:hypothetical protein
MKTRMTWSCPWGHINVSVRESRCKQCRHEKEIEKRYWRDVERFTKGEITIEAMEKYWRQP